MIKVGYCGYNLTETEKFAVYREHGSGDWLFVLFITPFYIFSADGNSVVTEPTACVLFAPDKFHYYQAVKKFTNSFIHFSSDEEIISELNIPTNTILYLKKPEAINHLLKEIVREAVNKTQHYERKISNLVNNLLVDLSREIHGIKHSIQDISMYEQFRKMRQFLIDNCESDWTTQSICKLTHMEKSQLHNYYTSFFKTTPKADIIFARIEKAKTLLANQEMNVNQVAEICGFKSSSHFIRVFKKHVTCSPGEFAQQFSDNVFVLFDAQEELKSADAGIFFGNKFLFASEKFPPKLFVTEFGEKKSILVSDRPALDSGLVIQIPATKNLRPGDKITVAGRIDGIAPKNDWAMVVRKYGGDNDILTLVPNTDEKFCITYVFDTADLETPVQIRSTHWGNDGTPVNFFVDSILITRDKNNSNFEIEPRKIIYSFANDEKINELTGDITAFIRPSGEPSCAVKKISDKKFIHVKQRKNNWDGVDILLPDMNLKQGNIYTIRAKGHIEDSAPPGATMMFQILPGYIWRSVVAAEENGEFVLSHTLSMMELQTAEAVRITSNPEGAEMSFAISEIEVVSKKSPQ